MSPHITCPTCSMTASMSDHRLLAPVSHNVEDDLRRCRNCGDVFDLAEVNPDASLAAA